MATATFAITQSTDDYLWYSSTWSYSASQHNMGAGTAVLYNNGFRFPNITIANATIDSCYLRLISTTTRTNLSSNSIQFLAADDAGTSPTSVATASAYFATRTTASAVWNITTTWTQASAYNSPDLKALLQEVIDRPGWVSGNAVAIRIIGTVTGSNRFKYFAAYDNTSYTEPQLVVTYTLAGATGLVIAAGYHPHSATSPTLSRTHTLVTADAAHGHFADNVGVIQGHQLLSDSAYHAHFADEVVVVQTSAGPKLAIADTTLPHSADGVTIDQRHVIGTEDGYLSLASEEVTLYLYPTTLAPADAEHSQAADNIDLSVYHELAVANSDLRLSDNGVTLSVPFIPAPTVDTSQGIGTFQGGARPSQRSAAKPRSDGDTRHAGRQRGY